MGTARVANSLGVHWLISLYATILERYLMDNPESALAAHGIKMIDEMVTMHDPVKLNRWFGFLQGLLYALGLRTIDELRDETRGEVNDQLVRMTREV